MHGNKDNGLLQRTYSDFDHRVFLRCSEAKVLVAEFLLGSQWRRFLIGAQGRWFWSQSFSEPVSDILLFVNMGTPQIKKK